MDLDPNLFSVGTLGELLVSDLKSKIVEFGADYGAEIAIGGGTGLVTSVIGSYIYAWLTKDSEFKREVKTVETKQKSFAPDNNCHRFILVTEKNMWKKRLQFTDEKGNVDYYLYSGEGTSEEYHPLFDFNIIDIELTEAFSYSFFKPKFLGYWGSVGQSVKYHDAALTFMGGRTTVVYWDEDGSGYFENNEGAKKSADFISELYFDNHSGPGFKFPLYKFPISISDGSYKF
eukprot:gene5649-7032_t